jgi:hypothetical protein
MPKRFALVLASISQRRTTKKRKRKTKKTPINRPNENSTKRSAQTKKMTSTIQQPARTRNRRENTNFVSTPKLSQLHARVLCQGRQCFLFFFLPRVEDTRDMLLFCAIAHVNCLSLSKRKSYYLACEKNSKETCNIYASHQNSSPIVKNRGLPCKSSCTSRQINFVDFSSHILVSSITSAKQYYYMHRIFTEHFSFFSFALN